MAFDTLTLESFIAVAETKSFTKAAERIGRTQSAVSQKMNKLESLLGQKLFVRGRNFALTSHGEIFLGYAQSIQKLQREALDRFIEPDLEGEVKFGLPEDFASVFLYDVLAEFSRLYPRIQLNVACDLTLNLFERFKKKEFDLVLVKMNRPQDFPNGHDIWSEKLEWVGPVDLLQKKSSIPLVLSPEPCVYRSRAIEALENRKQAWRIAFSSSSYAGTIAAVKARMGITVLPRNMVPDGFNIITDEQIIPSLDSTHISLLKHSKNNAAVNSLEEYVFKKLR